MLQAKPRIRKIKSLKKPAPEAPKDQTTPVATEVQDLPNEPKTEIKVVKPPTNVEVTNPQVIDKSTAQALSSEEAILYRTKPIFPLDIIPNELIIKEKSVSIIWNYAINSNTQTMLLKDIGYVTINDNKFVASLVISYKSPLENIEISNLKPQDAYEAKSIIEKLMIQISEGGLEKGPADETAILS